MRDGSDYRVHQVYIEENPAHRKFCEKAEEYLYSSGHSGFELDPAPQGLKPELDDPFTARLEGVPFQSKTLYGAPVQNRIKSGRAGTAMKGPNNNTAYMRNRTDISKILVLGSGPILIGQSA